jgi:TolB-like protein
MAGRRPSLRGLLEQLRVRKVYRVGAVYAMAAFVVLQVADVALAPLGVPDWAFALLVLAVVVGFPVAIALAWTFEITPEGVKPEQGEGLSELLGSSLWPRLAVTALVSAVSVGVGWAAWQVWVRPAETPTSLTVVTDRPDPLHFDPRRIAVLYFDDHSPGGDLGYLAAGLTEGLIHELASVPVLEVVSRNGVKPFRARDIPLDSIVQTLRAGTIVEGSVTHSAGLVRATVQLVDGLTGRHIDSRVVDHPETELLALQDSLARTVSRLLRERLGVEIESRESRLGTASPEAWQLLLRARERLDQYERAWRDDPTAGERILLRADEALQRAIEVDPEYVDAWLERGQIARRLGFLIATLPGSPAPGPMVVALGYAGKALQLDPDNSAALELDGVVRAELSRVPGVPAQSRLGREAIRSLERATAIDPGRAMAWWSLSRLQLLAGRFVEARNSAERALRADAYLELEPRVVEQLYQTALQFGPTDDAIRWCREGRLRFPEDADFVLCELYIQASVPQVEPDPDAAWATLDTLATTAAPSQREAFVRLGTMQVGKTLARAGLQDSARAVLIQARGQTPVDWLAYDEAHARLLLGEFDEAIDLLRQSLALDPDTAFLAKDWWFEELRDNPRFRDLVGLPDALD